MLAFLPDEPSQHGCIMDIHEEYITGYIATSGLGVMRVFIYVHRLSFKFLLL